MMMLWRGFVWCGVAWRGVMWCGFVWCGLVWCGVVWSGVVSFSAGRDCDDTILDNDCSKGTSHLLLLLLTLTVSFSVLSI
jgi:hypothetical protein